MSLPAPATPTTPPSDDPVSSIPSIFSPSTLVERGFAQVATGPERKAEGHKLYYELHGEDKEGSTRLVFLMGLSNSCFAWQHQVAHFASLPGYAVLVLDNRGVGHSDSPVSSASAAAWRTKYTTSEMAQDTLEVLEMLGWVVPSAEEAEGGKEGGKEVGEQKGAGGKAKGKQDEEAQLAAALLAAAAQAQAQTENGGRVKQPKIRPTLNLIGISMGGMVAQELALLIPAHIRALLLVSTSLSSLSSYPPFIRLPSLCATSLIIRQTLGLIKTPEEQVAGIVACLFPKAYLAQKAEGEGEGEARTNREVTNEEFLKRYNFGKRQTPVGRAGQTAAVMTHHLSATRRRILSLQPFRIAVIHGDSDSMISLSRGQEIHTSLPGSTMNIVPGGGHALPSQFTAAFNGWVQGQVEKPIKDLGEGLEEEAEVKKARE